MPSRLASQAEWGSPVLKTGAGDSDKKKRKRTGAETMVLSLEASRCKPTGHATRYDWDSRYLIR